MSSPENTWNDSQKSQLKYWLKHMSLPIASYKEPVLDETAAEVVKLICDILHQDDEVFIASVDVIEKYLYAKTCQNIEISNALLSIICAILMTSKLIGSHPEIKISALQVIIKKLTSEEIDRNSLKYTELDIFLTLGKLPLTNMAIDLSLLLLYYVKNLHLRANIEPLCTEILNIVYLCKYNIFYKLKAAYLQNVDARQVFQHLICNKMYFPAGIILCSLRITKYANLLKLEEISKDIGKIACIHHDHLQLLAGTIYEYFNGFK